MRLSFFFLLLPSVCFSQQTVNAEQFFALGLSNVAQVEKLAGEKVYFPWIDEYAFRTETRDLDFDKQEYTLRISPSTAKIRNAQKAFYEEMRNAPDFDGQEIHCDLILSLHLDWLSLYILHENLKILDERVIILNDKQTLFERMLGTYEFDPVKLVNLQMERSDIEIKLHKLMLERDNLLHKYNIQNQEINFGDFITVEALTEFLAYILSANESRIVDSETEYKKQLLNKEIELESSENKQLIDFVQLKYDGPHSDALQERLSVGLGFQLSKSGSKKLKMQELKIEQEELNRKSERNIQEKQAELLSLENKLQSDIQAFFHFQKIMTAERAQLQKLSSNISQKEGTSPLFLLNIEERHLSMKIKSLDNKEGLLKDYLKYLQESGEMCQPDFVNYLAQ